jgi:hypothetical protein
MPLALIVALLFAAPKQDPKLVGSWTLAGSPFMTLHANGTGSMDQAPVKWHTEGNLLVIADGQGGTDRVQYGWSGELLTISMSGLPLQLVRAGKGAPAPAAQAQAQAPRAGPGAPKAAPPPSKAGGDQLSKLLVSSNWCHLRYSNGNSYQQKVHFGQDGRWQDFSEGSIHSNSQYTNTIASSVSNSQTGGQWTVKGGQLYMSFPPQTPDLRAVPLTVVRNSNGWPILTADGKEYSMCN